MEGAWLDSLSEDWISEPRSGDSPPRSVPSFPSSTPPSGSVQGRSQASRIPVRPGRIPPTHADNDSSALPLSERNVNIYNAPIKHDSRPDSKLRNEISGPGRGRGHTRTLSECSTQSVQHHTVQHNKSSSLSPQRKLQDTPEWKRRLLHGDVAYGEQRDLFSPAGLESIFNPPPTSSRPSSAKSPERQLQSVDVTMRSSPPPYAAKNVSQPSEQKGPKLVSYKMADNSSDQFSEYDLSQSSSFRPRNTTTRKSPVQPPLVHISEAKPAEESSEVAETNHKIEDPKRLVSGQSDIRHEGLSPIYLSRLNTVDGSVGYAALDLSASQLQERLKELTVEDESDLSHLQNDSISQQLPQDPTMDTEDFAHNGNFVTLERGGRSQEEPFQRRILSPSMPSSVSNIDDSGILPEKSVQASTPKQLPTIQKTPASDEIDYDNTQADTSIRRTPQSSPAKDERLISRSGSPLKLFGAYDTFTNQKLLRRLSQFENNLPDDKDKVTDQDVKDDESGAEINEAYIAPPSTGKASGEKASFHYLPRAYRPFGEGKLDQFEFQEEVSLPSWLSSEPDDNDEHSRDLEPQEPLPAIFSLSPSFNFDDEGTTRRKTSTFTSRISRSINTKNYGRRRQKDSVVPPESPPLIERELLRTPRQRNADSQFKRLPRSPLKDPTPKRRRTLHKSDIAHLAIDDSVLESHQNIQSVISRKRKDARYDNNHHPANPETMAMRQILRPCTPSLSQRSNSNVEIERKVAPGPLTWSQKEKEEQQQKIAMVQAELDMTNSGQFVAPGIGHHMLDESRKPSVTTQDFLDEAKKIMAGIRGKARHGLTSLEESESEIERLDFETSGSQDPDCDESYQESSKEPFSRPPSREGGVPVPRQLKEQIDPELLDHLRKYEERSDLDVTVASSLRSTEKTKEVEEFEDTAYEVRQNQIETAQKTSAWTLNHDIPYESDPPNIRITEYPELQRKRKHSASSAPVPSYDGALPSYGSNPCSRQSTIGSAGTGSSRSDSRRVIAPHTVSHLIPEQLAGMVFDRENGIWMKRKAIIGSESGSISLPSDDDDPFGDIPDLTVDESQEQQRIQSVAARHREESRLSVVQEYQRSQLHASQDAQPSALQTLDGPISTNKPQSSPSEPSRYARSPSSGIIWDTRATSWGEEPEFAGKSDTEVATNEATTGYPEEILNEEFEEAEEEISFHESRRESRKGNRPRRSLTISFSSPVASFIHGNSNEQFATSILDHYYGESEHHDHSDGRTDTATFQQHRSSQRGTSRRSSLGGQSFVRRPISRIDERDEDSFAEYMDNSCLQRSVSGLQRSVSVLITTPMPTRTASHQISIIQQNSPDIAIGHNSLYQLSPLSDFTMNRAEESFAFEVSCVAPFNSNQGGKSSKRSLSMTVKELVQRITDVEPYEPYWEYIREINLKNKNLQSLHMLSKFCSQLEDLDVSDNELAQLDGMPESIRHLRITHNSLSDLTSWQHLRNLQYLDISNNDLTSLEGLKDLFHLRSVRADNNRIESVNGVFNLDGLISLRLRNNAVESVDFVGSRLQRLTDLDLKGNKLHSITGLQELQSLATLQIEDNHLETFNEESLQINPALKYLKLSGNSLQQIDVSHYPNLRLLYLDRNRLGRVTGLLKAKHLDSLSMREQHESSIDMSFLDHAYEVRKLFLSGNLLESFAPRVDFLNLQYLEMANCGLESLPADFGQMMGNLRVLNLNFNALRDLKPLIGIVRLKRLHVAGNRLTRLRKTTGVLSQFSSLANVDARNNPLTLGFYPIITEKRVILHEGVDDDSDALIEDPFTLIDADEAKDKAYAGRLDMETKLRRRVYEMLMVGGNERLRIIDGLPANAGIADVKDAVWDHLVKIGLVQGNVAQIEAPVVELPPQNQNEAEEDGNGSVTVEEEVEKEVGEEKQEEATNEDVEIPKEEDRGDQWQAEDSFA